MRLEFCKAADRVTADSVDFYFIPYLFVRIHLRGAAGSDLRMSGETFIIVRINEIVRAKYEIRWPEQFDAGQLFWHDIAGFEDFAEQAYVDGGVKTTQTWRFENRWHDMCLLDFLDRRTWLPDALLMRIKLVPVEEYEENDLHDCKEEYHGFQTAEFNRLSVRR